MRCKTIIGFTLLVLAAGGLHQAYARKNSNTLESRLLWKKDFSGAMIHAELLPKGILHIAAREGMKRPEGVKKENWPQSRYLLNSSGKIIWQGEAKTSAILADNPFAVILDGKILRALGPEGKEAWIFTLPEGILISKLADPGAVALYLAFMPLEWLQDTDKTYEAKIIALNLNNGQPFWSAAANGARLNTADALPEMVAYEDTIWWAGGGLAFALDRSNGSLLWQSGIAEKFVAPADWAFGGGNAFVSNEKNIWAFSKQKGLLWKTALAKDEKLQAMAWRPAGLAFAASDPKGVSVQFLNLSDGKTAWTKKFKHAEKKSGPAPRGLALYKDRLVLAAGGKIIGLALNSGETIFETPVKGKIFQHWRTLRPKKDYFVLTGPEGAYAYSADKGGLLWQQSDFIEPVQETRKLRQATLQAAFESANSGQSQEASKAWSDYHRGSKSYASASMEASFAQQKHNAQAAAQARQSAANISKGLTGAIEIDISLANRTLGSKYAFFYRHRGMKIGKVKAADHVDAAFVDLDTGELVEVDLPKAHSACVSQVLIDPANRQVYQAYRQMALMCKDENKLNVYQY